MLERVEISNFRCLRDVSVPTRPLTVLIGKNDSGKSAFLAAVRHLAEARAFHTPFDYWRLDTDQTPHVVGRTKAGRIDANPDRDLSSDPPQAWRDLSPVGWYDLPSEGVLMQAEGSPSVGGVPELGERGEAVAAVLDYLLRRERGRFFQIVEAVRGQVPGLEEINIETPGADQRRIDLVIENNVTLPAHRASSGVRLLIFFIALAYHPRPPRLILIEEPENGVHPKRLADVVKLLREITQGKHGDHAAQVVLTTHSPYLLDCINPEEDQVLVFRREEDGSRTAEPADTERLKNFLDEFMLGEIWFNEEEDGLVGRGK